MKVDQSSPPLYWKNAASPKSIPNLLVIAIILLVAAFVIVSQQGLHFDFPHTNPAIKSVVVPPAESAAAEIPFESSDSPQEITPLEEQGSGIHSNVRHFHPIGVGAYAFVLAGGYRTDSGRFAVVGLASKPFHVFARPKFACEWIPSAKQRTSTSSATSVFPPPTLNDTSDSSSSRSVFGRVKKLLPDWNYGRVYTVVVLHCNFKSPVGEDGSGGKLVLHVSSIDRESIPDSKITAFTEAPGSFNAAQFSPPFKYDYLYCGSSLFGDINPDRMREWIAYHSMLLGPRSHFVFHDVGGANSAGIRQVLEPWVRLGRVTVQDFREEAKFDGYYHNQFLVVNDCLFRYKFAANWTFFFDVDEYLFVPKPATIDSVLSDLGRNYSQIMFEQHLMSHNMCAKANPKHKIDSSRQWGFEKLVFKNVKTSVRLDRKYVLRAALADSAGVHLSENVRGQNLYSHGKLWYYHYHNTITDHEENCKEFVEVPKNRTSKVWIQKTPYSYDDSVSAMGPAVRKFEVEQMAQAAAL